LKAKVEICYNKGRLVYWHISVIVLTTEATE